MSQVGRSVPVLPVSLVASVFTRYPESWLDEDRIKSLAFGLIEKFQKNGAYVHIPRHDPSYAVRVGLRILTLRHFVVKEENRYRAAARELPILAYYADAIANLSR